MIRSFWLSARAAGAMPSSDIASRVKARIEASVRTVPPPWNILGQSYRIGAYHVRAVLFPGHRQLCGALAADRDEPAAHAQTGGFRNPRAEEPRVPAPESGRCGADAD